MNAQTQTRSAPAWKSYLPIVDQTFRGATPDERRLRCRIMVMRDQANAARHKAVAWHADQALSTVEQLGLAYAMSSVSLDQLNAVRENMALLFQVAASLNVRCPEGSA